MGWTYTWIYFLIFVSAYAEQNGIWRLSKAIKETENMLELDDNFNFPNVELWTNYSKHEVPPHGPNAPLRVNFSINLSSILAVDEPNQAVSLESTIRLYWFDERITIAKGTSNLRYDTKLDEHYLLFNRNPVKHLWFPDVFIAHAKELRVPVYQIPPLYLRIYENGRMMYSARVNYDISCPMK